MLALERTDGGLRCASVLGRASMGASVTMVSAAPSSPVLAGVAHPLAGQEGLDVEKVVRPAGDVEQRRHRCHLLDLLLEEPKHELFTQGIVFRPGRGKQFLDAVRDRNLLGKHQGPGVPPPK